INVNYFQFFLIINNKFSEYNKLSKKKGRESQTMFNDYLSFSMAFFTDILFRSNLLTEGEADRHPI
ncbi:hypothetical protein, partial [Heyndrickxia sporothermodurans]|uniref:hypothetical protein n=2 Tax=Heyndrickxia sporothermodurans TaxID=46224 RepID=UPI0036376B0F